MVFIFVFIFHFIFGNMGFRTLCFDFCCLSLFLSSACFLFYFKILSNIIGGISNCDQCEENKTCTNCNKCDENIIETTNIKTHHTTTHEEEYITSN